MGMGGETQDETFHHSRPHVLDDEIAPLRHAMRERYPLRLLQIDRDAVFRIVEEGKAAAAIISRTIVLERRILNAKTIGPLTRLHMHGAGSEIRQHLSDMRTRGIAAELEDFEVSQSLRDGGHDWLRARVVGARHGASEDARKRADASPLRGASASPGSWRSGGRAPSITAKLPQKRSREGAMLWKKPRASSWGSLAISATVDPG